MSVSLYEVIYPSVCHGVNAWSSPGADIAGQVSMLDMMT
jgi:hypothetical protein